MYKTISFVFLVVNFILLSFSKGPCSEIPPLNKGIISFVKSTTTKKIGSGECWDLAAEALNKVGASWDGKLNFGKEVNYNKVCIYPGDIVQFEGVELKYEKDNIFYMEKLEHHTAIVYEVKEKGNFVIADQNTRFSGRTVGTHPFAVKDITKGKFKIYRPIK